MFSCARRIMAPRVRYTADILVFHSAGDVLSLLTITRKNPPFKGCLALPGGFVDPGEDAEIAAARELEEETHVRGLPLTKVGIFDKPGRDPRGAVVTTAFLAFAPNTSCSADDDAASAGFRPVLELAREKWSFDHHGIVLAALHRAVELVDTNTLGPLLPPGLNVDVVGPLLEDGVRAFSAPK